MVVTEAHEIVTAAGEMIFTSLVTGQEVGERLQVPEIRSKYAEGHTYTACNKSERDKLLKSKKWKEITCT